MADVHPRRRQPLDAMAPPPCAADSQFSTPSGPGSGASSGWPTSAASLRRPGHLCPRHPLQRPDHRRQGERSLHVLWAPVLLLIRLGSLEEITAYDIEDIKEMWPSR
ncbi:hypothetical protein HU200_038129 [Digitaria exilis]|uniref:Uncharacterized protein n=1 Tax=Digitaria exilis TaxID=1010633 RepID=A0A835BPF4_9POAL|nr:hypothetical protein HU200_038129 [Digitaria exilis]